MVNDKETVEGSAQPTTKKVRRGVSNQTKAVAQLRFHEKDAAQNMLFVGHLESVIVEWSNNPDSKQFTGLAVPRVVLHFASNHTVATEQRHVYYNINPVESNVLTVPGGDEEWKVNNVLHWLKHMLDIFYLKGREMTEQEEDALAIPFVDYDENGNYLAIDANEVINGYRFIFENFAAMMNGQFNLKEGEVAKPCFKTVDGKIIPCWMKLLRHKRRKNEWRDVAQNGELGFDSFIGSGVVELVKKDSNPMVLRVDIAKESITPKETRKQPSVGIPAMGGVIPSGPINMGNGDWNGASADAASDMPF